MSDPDSPPEAASIGERIRWARKRAGLNQAKLAERLGVSQPAVANWESGVHDPRRVVLAKLADALGAPLDWLADGARSPVERDTHAAAAYLRRALRHTPIIRYRHATRFLETPFPDPHDFAEDYIPVTTNSQAVFALFVSDEAVDLAFPQDSLVVIDYADRRPADGAFCLAAPFNYPILRRWRENPDRFEPQSSNPQHLAVAAPHAPCIIGCARVSIRFH